MRNIFLKKIFLALSLIPAAMTAQTSGAEPISVSPKAAGMLSELLSAYNPTDIRNLVIEGLINASDIRWMRQNLDSLRAVDMGRAHIVADYPYFEGQMPDSAFFRADSRIEKIVMPTDLVSIGNRAFMFTRISSVVIPRGVVYFGRNVFNSCYWLEDVTALNPNPVFINWCVFANTGYRSRDAKLHVPEGSVDAYRNYPQWQLFTTIVGDAPGVVNSVASVVGGNGHLSIKAVGNMLEIEAGAGASVSIVTADGREVAKTRCDARGKAQLHVDSGLYMVVCGSESVKIKF